VTSISLRPLGQQDGERLIEGLLGWESIPVGLRAGLIERAEGNPFFLEQLVGNLIDTGALLRDGGEWRLERAGRAVRRVVARRIRVVHAVEVLVHLEHPAVSG